ncbi:hypothetical protein B0O99DRAFT_640073 [Bisporella sp. PMI_857]|nr:hypothetical protein B0O99DRAFT_640073 [Bisporella sp. PMI_857]
MGQIIAYSHMMIQGGHLPPFVYPPCELKNAIPGSCVGDGYHRCLPQPLANCASLVRMFYRRTPKSSSFIWKAIYDEQLRLRNKYHTYDKETILSVIQAVMIYLLL